MGAGERRADPRSSPSGYDLPCLWFDPIAVDRSLPLGEPVDWHEYELTIHALPGHTLYAAAIEFEVDGRRVLATGDQQTGGERPILNYQYRNRFAIDDYVRSAELYRALRPDVIVSGHWLPLEVTDDVLDGLEADGARLAELHRELLPLDEVDLGLEGFAARIEPYRSSVLSGEPVVLDVSVRNPFGRAGVARVALVVAPGWAAPQPQELELDARAIGVLRFEIETTGVAPVERALVAADVTVDGGPVRPAGRGAPGDQVTGPVVRDDGSVLVEAPRYRLEVRADGLRATLTSSEGEQWLALRPLAAFDRTDGLDETLAVSPPRVADGRIEIERRSTLWDDALTTLTCSDETIELRSSVRGHGELTDLLLLAGRSLLRGRPHGLLPSGSALRTIFSPNPSDDRAVRPASEPAVIGVVGDGEPGRGHWLFTPAPLYLAFTTAAAEEAGEWLDLGLAAPVAELTFTQLAYEPRDGGIHLRLEYEGHTRVDGAFAAPALLLTPGVADPYEGLRRHREELAARGAAPRTRTREVPAWWSEPIFCGWGAQCYLESKDTAIAATFATQENYDAFLAELERHGVVPGTVVLDDKWQAAYGTNEPDQAKWPDLRGWIAGRHARGQHVLLWWKAWDPEGVDPELCIRNPDGEAMGIDPGNPAAREVLRASVLRMLSADGLDADGLKIDFTARTPSGRALARRGERWGIALLHELLELVYAAAKEAKEDALVMTHTPHPAFVDVTDMVRLNDMIGGVRSVVPQMRHRAQVALAACPELLIDTDDWRVPNLAAWREYLEAKPELGIPSLYYVSHLDATGEALEPRDYAAIADAWSRWEAGHP